MGDSRSSEAWNIWNPSWDFFKCFSDGFFLWCFSDGFLAVFLMVFLFFFKKIDISLNNIIKSHHLISICHMSHTTSQLFKEHFLGAKRTTWCHLVSLWSRLCRMKLLRTKSGRSSRTATARPADCAKCRRGSCGRRFQAIFHGSGYIFLMFSLHGKHM